MGGETFASISRLTRAKKLRGGNGSVTLAVFLSSVLLCTFVAICECQRLNPEHRDGGDDGGIPLEDYGEDDGEGVVPIMSHRQGLQHEDVLTALPSQYFVPNQAQFPPSPVYQPGSNGTSAQSTSATPAEGSVGKDGKNFTPPNDIVRGFKPVYPDDARFVSITTSTVVPPHGHHPKRRKKVKRVKGQNQQQQQQNQQGQQQGQQQPQQGQQQGFQNSFGYQPTGPGAGPYFHPYAHSQVQNSGPYFAAANHFYGYSPNGLDGQNGSYPGHIAFPNDTSGAGAPPNYSTLYSTNPNINQGQDNHQQQYQQQQQQSGPYLSSGVPLAGAPGFGGPGPHGPPLGPHGYPMHGPPKMNPLKKLANLIRGRPRPPHGPHMPPHGPPPPGHGGMPPPHQGPGAPGVPYQHLAASVNQQQVVPPGQPYPGPGPQGQGPPRYPPYNPNQPPQYQHPQQQQQPQPQQAPSQNQTQSQQNSNSTSPGNPQAAASNTQGAYPGFPGGQPPPYGPHRPPNPNKNFLSKLNLNGYLKKFSNMFRTGPPQPGQGAPQGVPPGPGGKPGVAVPLVQQHGPPPQQKVPQQMLYPHYYPLNSYAPNGPNQGQYQQQGQPQNPQQPAPGGQGQNQIRRRRIKIRKNSGMDPRNRKVDDAPEGQGDQKELIGRPRLAPGQTNDAEQVDEDIMAEGEPPREIDPNAGGRKRRKRLATTSSVITSSSSSTSTSSSSGYRMPGLFGMDSGKAFYLDKDPQTGDITFNPPSGQSNSGENKNGQNNSGNGSPSNSNELSPDAKSKPIIIHSYSNTKTQGGLSTYKRPNLSSLNHKFKAKRPTFYRFNKTSTLAPPRLPSFYVPSSTTVFTTTSTTTTSTPSQASVESIGKTEFPNVIVAKSSSEIVTRVSMSSSSSSSKEIAGPQFKKKSPVKFPLFKHTTPSTTTTSESGSTAGTTTTTTESSTTVPTTTEGSTTTPEPETSTASTTTNTTTEEPTSSTMFFDPYLPFELLNLQKQAMATAKTPTSTTTTTTTTEVPTTTSTSTTTEHSTIPTTVDPYTVPNSVKAVPTTASSSTAGSDGGAESPSTVAPGQSPENANGSSLIPTGPDAEQTDTSQEQPDEDEDYYYDNPDPGQGYVVNPGQFNSFGQFRPGSIPPHHQHPGNYYNPMMGGGLQGRPPVVPPQHPNNFFNSFNPFGPPGYYPQPPPQNIQGGAGYFNPELQGVTGPEPVPSTNEEVISNSSVAPTTEEEEEVTTPSTTSSTTTTPTTTTIVSTTTTTTPEPTTTTEPTTPSTTTTTTTTTIPPPSPTQEDLLGEPDIYEEYEDELELDPSGLPPTLQQPQQKLPPNSFQLPLPPQPPQRPQPPIPPHRRPPPPFINRLPPMYFNNQRPPPVRPQGGNFPFRPPPPVKEVMKPLTSSELTPAPTTITSTSTTPSTTTTAATTTSTTTTTTTTPPPTTTSTTTTTTPPPTSSASPEPHIPSESREAVINQDLFIPPEQLLAYTPSPDRAQDRIPDEVIQDIAPGFDLFNVQWGQKVPPPSSTSYSSQELQPIPMQAQLSTTTIAPPTTRIISRNITEVNINGTDYIYEYIDEIVEEDVPTNSSQNAPQSEQGNNVAPTSAIPQQQFISPEQFYNNNPYLMPQYNGFVPVSSTPGYGGAGPPPGQYMMHNGAPAWLQNGYYLPPGVLPNQYPIQGIDGSQQFIPVGAHFNPSSIAPPQDLRASPSPSSPSPSPIISSSAGPVLISSMGSSHEILSDTSILPPVIPITENSVDNISPSQEQHNQEHLQEQTGAELSESYIVSLIDPSKQNVTVTLNGIIGSSTERLPLYQGEADTVEHTNLLVSSTSGTPAPGGVEHLDGISHISSPAPVQTDPTVSTTTTEKAASYEYIDYPDENLAAVPGGGGSPQQQQQQLHNLQALQMMRPPPPLPPHLQQQQLQHQQQTQALLGLQGQQGPPPQHGPHGPHGPKKKPSSFLQNLFGKLTGNGGPPPQQNGQYPPQGPPQHGGPGQNRNNFAGDNIASASGPVGAGSSLLPPVMIPNGVDPEKFNMDTLFGARNGTAAEDPQPPAPSSTQTTSTTAGASSTSTTTTGQASALSAEFGSDEEDEVIYVTPEELAKLKETGQVDDFELVEDEEEYEYEDEPLNDIADNKLARSDTKSLSGLGQNGTSELLKKTAPVAPPPVSEAPSTTTASTTTTSTAAPSLIPSSSQIPPVLEAVAQERKQDFYGGSQQQAYGQVAQTPPAALPSIPSLGMFQMKPPSEFARPPHAPPPHPHQGMPPHRPQSHPHQHQHQPHHPHQYHQQQQHHQGRIPVAPPPPPFRGPYQHQQHPSSIPNPSHNHYKPNNPHGHVAPPAGHYYTNQMTPGSVLPSASPPIQTPADKRQDGFQAKFDYDDDIELITAGPMLDPNVPRDIIVKSSFNTASGSQAKPKSISAPSPSPSSPSTGGGWQGGVENVSSFDRRTGYLQAQQQQPSPPARVSGSPSPSHHDPFSTFARALPNHYDKNAHLRQLQQTEAGGAGSSNYNGGGSHVSSNRNYWGPGI